MWVRDYRGSHGPLTRENNSGHRHRQRSAPRPGQGGRHLPRFPAFKLAQRAGQVADDQMPHRRDPERQSYTREKGPTGHLLQPGRLGGVVGNARVVRLGDDRLR